jgi:ribosomal protein S18 acetylase RimI-like enzyme
VSAADIPAGSEPKLRDARPEELDEVGRLLAVVYGSFRPHLPPEVWPAYIGEIVDVRARLADSELVVAADAGRLVGTVAFFPDASRSALERWPEGWASIRTLAVIPEARGRGVGEALALECVRRARERGVSTVGLHTHPSMVSATRLYERLGFRRAPELDVDIGAWFAGGTPAPAVSWVAHGFRLDLKPAR